MDQQNKEEDVEELVLLLFQIPFSSSFPINTRVELMWMSIVPSIYVSDQLYYITDSTISSYTHISSYTRLFNYLRQSSRPFPHHLSTHYISSTHRCQSSTENISSINFIHQKHVAQGTMPGLFMGRREESSYRSLCSRALYISQQPICL